MKKIGLLLLIFLLFSCGNKSENSSNNTSDNGTLFTGYVPGEIDSGKSSVPTNNDNYEETEGIEYEISDNKVSISKDNVQILENQLGVGIVGNTTLDNTDITISFSFFKSATYPKTYNLVIGNPSNEDATFFYQEAVSNGENDYIEKVKDGILVIDKYNETKIEGEFWAKIGMQSGKEVYIKNGKIYLKRGQ